MIKRQTIATRRASLAFALLPMGALGAQSVASPPAEVIEINKVEVNPLTGGVTLRWSSQTGSTYLIEETSNPKLGWLESVQNISGDSLETTYQFLPQGGNSGARAMLFRIRKMEGATPEESDLQVKVVDEDGSFNLLTTDDSGNAYADLKSRAGEASTHPFRERKQIPASRIKLSETIAGSG